MLDPEDPNFWLNLLKQLWDFGKNVVSDTLAPWVNRALPHFVSPTVRIARTHTPAASRFVRRELVSFGDALAELLRFSRRSRVAQVGSVVVVAGLALGETPAAQWAPVVVGPPLMLYLCWAYLDGLQRKVRAVFNVLG